MLCTVHSDQRNQLSVDVRVSRAQGAAERRSRDTVRELWVPGLLFRRLKNFKSLHKSREIATCWKHERDSLLGRNYMHYDRVKHVRAVPKSAEKRTAEEGREQRSGAKWIFDTLRKEHGNGV